MGLRCLLGHDYGDPETEHEREEAGSEVVTTVREVERCRRCGDTRIVSQNKEVRRIDGEPASGAESVGRSDAAPGTADAADVAGPVDGLVDDEPAGDEPGDDESSHPTVDDGVDETVTDDAVIVDGDDGDEPADDGSATGEETADADPAEDDGPSDDGETGGRDPVTDSTEVPDPADGDDGVILDDDGDDGDPAAPSEGGSEAATDAEGPAEGGWPDHDGAVADAEVDAESVVGDVETNGAADASEESFAGLDVGDEGRTTVDADGAAGDLHYRCPECGHTEPVGESSMRAGDICPECRRSYIEEHVRN